MKCIRIIRIRIDIISALHNLIGFYEMNSFLKYNYDDFINFCEFLFYNII